MKNWLISKIAGPLGMIVRPILAAIIGVIVGIAYEQMWIGIYQVGWLKFLCEKVIAQLDPAIIQAMTPQAIGGIAAIGAWAWASDWIISRMRGGNEQVQHALNALPNAPNVKVDGIITKDGETTHSVTRLAYEAMYPHDTDTRGGSGIPETRRPIP